MANPFYARYIPPSIAILRKEPQVNFESHYILDRAQSTKKRKTKSGFKPIIRSGEASKIPIEFDVSVSETNEVQLPEGKHGNREKERTEKNGKSGSLMPSTLSESVRNGKESSPESSLKEEIAKIEVEYINEKSKGKKKTGKKEKKRNLQSSTVEGGADDNKLLSQNVYETKH